jgi:hypothetical protein
MAGVSQVLRLYEIALFEFQGRGVDDVLQPDFWHSLLLESFIFQGLKNELRYSGNIGG